MVSAFPGILPNGDSPFRFPARCFVLPDGADRRPEGDGRDARIRFMDKTTQLLIAGGIAFAAGMMAGSAFANDRYQPQGHIIVSPDLAAPWVNQLQPGAADPMLKKKRRQQLMQAYQGSSAYVKPKRPTVVAASAPARAAATPRSATQAEAMGRRVDSVWLPQIVNYDSNQKPGTIIIDTNARHLYLVMGDGKARRYGVGVGKPGFEWAGTHKVTRKAEWPAWTPPEEMKVRVRLKEGRILPDRMEGGPENPLGARAMYLGSTLYRIHGTNQPWTIGQAVSSGCIRMRNEDVIDLYERTKVGAKVVVM
jgi:lipoprotein-anchoring transpeptidase ErfK/SrfK